MRLLPDRRNAHRILLDLVHFCNKLFHFFLLSSSFGSCHPFNRQEAMRSKQADSPQAPY